MKKLICIALALVMVLGLAITANAADQVTLVMAEVNPLATLILALIDAISLLSCKHSLL